MPYNTIGEPSKPMTQRVTMFIGPSVNSEPLEVGVVDDDEGIAVIHAMPARPKFLKGWWTR